MGDTALFILGKSVGESSCSIGESRIPKIPNFDYKSDVRKVKSLFLNMVTEMSNICQLAFPLVLISGNNEDIARETVMMGHVEILPHEPQAVQYLRLI